MSWLRKLAPQNVNPYQIKDLSFKGAMFSRKHLLIYTLRITCWEFFSKFCIVLKSILYKNKSMMKPLLLLKIISVLLFVLVSGLNICTQWEDTSKTLTICKLESPTKKRLSSDWPAKTQERSNYRTLSPITTHCKENTAPLFKTNLNLGQSKATK